MRRIIGLLVAGSMLAAGLLAITGIPSIAGGSGPEIASAATPPQQIGLKLLLITDSTTDGTPDGTAYVDWANTLNREGVPYDTFVTSARPLVQSDLSTTSNGTEISKYEGVVVAGSGTDGLTPQNWDLLQTYEQHFSVRQVTANAVPGPDYGLNTPANGGDSLLDPATTTLSRTADGMTVFPYLKTMSLDPGYPTFGAETTLASDPSKNTGGGTTDTLVSGPGNSTMVGIYTTPDGRETMFQTFNMGPGYLQSELLRHGELAWLARNTYFGDQRNYLETNIDDNFLGDDAWCAPTAPATTCGTNGTVPAHSTDFTAADALREVPNDVTKAVQWSQANNFRIDMLFNGGGSAQYSDDNGGATDPLIAAFKNANNSFGWINHTLDHPNLDEGCATAGYIKSEIDNNTSWATTNLALSSTTGVDAPALGNQDPTVVVTGEHSGLANLIPGNPGQVDPPDLQTPVASATGGTLPASSYFYAVSDQFNIQRPGDSPETATATGAGESAPSISAAVPATGTTSSVPLSWEPVCHAADYKIYRATANTGPWSLIATVPASPSTDFGNSGPVQGKVWFTDDGKETVTSVPSLPTSSSANEGYYEQNPNLIAGFGSTLDGGIKYFGADASKPYPNGSTGAATPFLTGAPGTGIPTSYPFPTFAKGAVFPDGSATGIPRYPTNIFYNVSTQAQETDEFNHIYQEAPNGACDPTIRTDCMTGTAWTFQQILDSIVGKNGPYVGMFQHMMGNDPRPDYFHQSNMMSQPGASVPAKNSGDGLYYSVMDELLAQYKTYFADNAPIEQPTMAQIGTLLNEQNAWAAANATQVTGSIQAGTTAITVNNGGTSAVPMPLTGTTGGTPYAGSVSYWTSAAPGQSPYTAVTAWPAPPTVPAAPAPPTGNAPTFGGGTTTNTLAPGSPKTGTGSNGSTQKHVVAKPIAYVAVQVKPKTVSIKHGKVIISLQCRATKGKTAKNKLCAGKFTLKVSGHNLSSRFRFRSSKTHRFTVKLSTKVMSTAARARRHNHHRMGGSLLISTSQTHAKSRLTHGTLTIRI